ncbi:MAG: tyrosine-type recombinase/integrase [Bdellovibrio sp.]
MKRKYEGIKNHAGIYKVLISEDGLTWHEPKRGSKYAASRYEGRSSKRSKRHFDRFEDAKNFRAKQERIAVSSAQEMQVHQPSEQKYFKFEDAIGLYEKTTLANKAASSQTRYHHYKKHFAFFTGMAVESIDTIIIDKWITWLKRPEYLQTQHSTRCNFKSEFTLLRGILNTYTSRINRNYRMPFIKEHRAAIKVKESALVVKDLTPEELKRFLKTLEDICKGSKWEFIYYLALMQYLTFSRIQDATALHFEDFNFDRGEITLNKKIMFGRSQKEETTLESGAKANRGKIIPMSETAAKVFKEWTMRAGIRHGPLFIFEGSWPRYRCIEYRYTKALRLAGLNQSATHVLRHASLTEAQEICGDLNQTKILAGHKSTKTTERYAKVRTHQIKETQNKLDIKLSGLLDGSQRFANEVI